MDDEDQFETVDPFNPLARKRVGSRGADDEVPADEPRATGPVMASFFGNKELAVSYMGVARTLLGQLKTRIGVNEKIANDEPYFGKHKAILADGTVIEVISSGGQDIVRIVAGVVPPPQRPGVPPPVDVPLPLAPIPDAEVEPGTRIYIATFDGVTLVYEGTEQVGEIAAGDDSDGWYIALSPDGTRLYRVQAFNAKLDVYDTETFELLDTIVVGEPFTFTGYPMVSPDGDRIYVPVAVNFDTVTVAQLAVVERTFVGDDETFTVIANIEFPGFAPSGIDTYGEVYPLGADNIMASPTRGAISVDGSKIIIFDPSGGGTTVALHPPLYDPGYNTNASLYSRTCGFWIVDTESFTQTLLSMPQGPFRSNAGGVRSTDGSVIYTSTSPSNVTGDTNDYIDPAKKSQWSGVPRMYWALDAETGAVLGTVNYPYPFPDEGLSAIAYEEHDGDGRSYTIPANGNTLEVRDLITAELLQTADLPTGASDMAVFVGNRGVGVIPLAGAAAQTIPSMYHGIGASEVVSQYTDASWPLYEDVPGDDSRTFKMRIREVLSAESGVSSPFPRLVFEILNDRKTTTLYKKTWRVTTPPDVYRYRNVLEAGQTSDCPFQPYYDPSVVTLESNPFPPPDDIPVVNLGFLVNLTFEAENFGPPAEGEPDPPVVRSEMLFYVDELPGGGEPLTLYPDVWYDLVFNDHTDPTAFTVAEE